MNCKLQEINSVIKHSKLKINFHQNLHKYDTEIQTYGCRHSNSDICESNMLLNICAFASKDCICKRPSKAWKKQYLRLKDKEV